MAKRADDFFRVMHVHLATESLNVEGFIRRHVESEYTAATPNHDRRGGCGESMPERVSFHHFKLLLPFPSY
jgi:hypothetical protein